MTKHLIGIDYESFFDQEYSLSKMPTHQYIRDARWRCLGCGFQFNDEAPFYVEDPEPIFRKIDDIGWDNVIAVAHNARFDGSVLYERFGRRRPGMWLDTQLIARYLVSQAFLPPEQSVSLAALAPLVGMKKGNTWDAVHGGGRALTDYGVEDIRIMMALLRFFLDKAEVPAQELTYMDMHIRMSTEPRLVTDTGLLTEAATVSDADKKLASLLRKDANMVKLLAQYGEEVEYKTTPKGQRKPALAKTDSYMQRLMEHDNPKVAEIASLRLGANSSITRTRAERMLAIGDPMPFPLLYYAAHTGRAGGQDKINPQNFPAGGGLRQALRAPDGYRLVVGDSNQIEARYVGWRAGDAALVDIFRQADNDPHPKRDPYRIFGGRYMYNKAPEDLEDQERKIAKAGLLGLGFGQGAYGLAKGAQQKSGLIIPPDTATMAVNTYRGTFSRVPQWWKRLMRWARNDGYVDMPDGRRIYYPDLREEENEEGRLELVYDRPVIFSKGPRGKRQTAKVWHGICCENDTQGGARSVVFGQAAGMQADGLPIIGMSHDEVISLVPEDAVNDAVECMQRWLATPPDWAEGLPLQGEVNVGMTYAEVK